MATESKATESGLMSVAAAAEWLDFSLAFVYARVADGSLGHYRLGKGKGGIRISEEQLQAYLKEREQGGGRAKAPVIFTHVRQPS